MRLVNWLWACLLRKSGMDLAEPYLLHMVATFPRIEPVQGATP